ncbi:protein kinase [Dactylosporangium aurantiacum]|uniref:non-specific serine/threonine protein kinase n=1 Tax=Dactylosporangium aurantiacum TaxID=35754 RepID=A0A9Q9I8S1_9ACTN|nr:serine/threonine-protein kinase [Dactylosporangium aurantiacum]MDG6107188.1 tetratricopeptide repeat protein [Dactylosporangium aurantiacum]UWZ51482.1 protein kinase [Dactylosporangium aurantiacum]
MSQCAQAGCPGSYDEDGYCDECGHKQAGAGVPAPVTEGSTPSAAGGASGRTSGRSTGRGRGAAPLVALPALPRRDPAGAVLPDPQVPEHRRFCGSCEQPVGRARDGRPALVEGFCPNCRTRYNFRPSLPPGAVVAGRYEVLGAIAYGGLGWIYLARDRNVGDEVSDRWVVLKGLIDSGDPDATAAAITERRFLVEVDHPSIVKIYDFVSHPDPSTGDRVGYIVMEYVGGLSLRDIYLARPVTGGTRQPLPLPQVIAYALEILPALGYLHERDLLYCDFKPDNALHTDQRVKLVDLGAVRRADDDVSAVWGTVGYQAPEVATAGPSVASDLYTVARSMAVLSFDFCGFTTTFVDHLPDPATVPLLAREESYHRLLLRATDRDPARRFGSAAEMAEQLTGVLRQVLSAADGRPRPGVSTQFTGERRAFGTAAGLVTAGTALGAGDGAGTARPDGAEVAAGLPVPTVDPADPGAALLATMPTADPELLSAALYSVGGDAVEVTLAVVRARIAAGDLDGAAADLDGVSDPDWRVDWHRGMVALAAGRPGEARAAFDAVYGALPGELAPQLALAAAAEADGDTDTALRHYAAVWRTDRSFVSAAFGVARILAARDDLPGAVAVLDAVPDSSSHSVPAQVAAVRARLAAPADRLGEPDLIDVSGRVERLGLDVERRARLTVETLRAALAWVQAGNAGTASVLTRRLSERDLRLGLEQAFRVLAKVAPDRDTRIGLVDQANRVRPRTWL